MEQLLEFLMNHPILTLVFVGLLGTLLGISFRMGGGGRIAPTDATRLINHEEAVVLDVRNDAEFRKGHIVNALNIPRNQLEHQLNKLNKHKGKPVIAVCGNGQDSQAVAKVLKGNGFENVYNLSGGLGAWQSANLPLTTES